jgi:serine protease Do
MKFWKTGVIALGMLGAAGAGAALAPTAYGQGRMRAIEPAEVRAFSTGGSRIGVSVSDVDAAAGDQTTGVRIDSVEEDSPAAKAGLQKGDIVIEFDGERVRSVRQFSRLVSETPAGRQVAAAVTRDGRRTTVNITPREASGTRWLSGDTLRRIEEAREMSRIVPRVVPPKPPSPPRAPEFDFEPFTLIRGNQLGVTVNSLSDQLKEYFGVKDGVLVTSVTEDSAAARAGVKAGDVIVSVNGSTVDSPSELREEMSEVDPGVEFTLEVMRDKKSMTLKGRSEERRSRRWTIVL